MNEHDSGGPRHAHERRDVDYRYLAIAVAILVGLMVLAVVVSSGAMGLLGREDPAREPPLVAAEAPARLPPQPRLQVVPEQDFAALRAVQHEQLDTYGWVAGPDAGVVRIPIDRAMQLLAERGLPEFEPTETGRESGAAEEPPDEP